MKLILSALLLFSAMASAQTSSTLRNRIIRNADDYLARAQAFCEKDAEEKYQAQTNWLYSYKGKFLNDCYQTFKMTLLKRHKTHLQERINFLQAKADRENSRSLRLDVEGLKQGMTNLVQKIKKETEAYKGSCYERRSLNETTVDLQRHIKKVGLEYFELVEEMKAEGSFN